MIYRLRLASNARIDSEMRRIQGFFAQNAHKQVRERAPEVLRDAIDRAALLLLEDEKGVLQGTCAQIHHGEGTYSETGAVRILINGFGLQSIMMGICAINEYLFAPPKDFIFAITAADNDPSLKSIPRAGFVLAKPNRDFLNEVKYGEGFPADRRFFRFSPSHSGEILNKIIDLAKSQKLDRRNNSISLVTEHPLFRSENLHLLDELLGMVIKQK